MARRGATTSILGMLGVGALLVSMLTATADDLLLPEAPASGKLVGREPLGLSLGATAGDYVRGRLQSPDGSRFALDLVTADGHHLRRLVDPAEGTGEFQFVAPSQGILKLTGSDGDGGYRLTIDRLVARAAMAPPEPEIESPRLARLATDLAVGGSTAPFWDEVSIAGTPLVEPIDGDEYLVTFLARGPQTNARVLGAPSGDHESLYRLGSSDVWYRSFAVPGSTRMSYQLAYDVPEIPGSFRERRAAILATAKVDPLNRHPWPDSAIDDYARNSSFTLPGAPPQPWIGDQGKPKGSLQVLSFDSPELGNRRDITIYRPPGFDPANPDNVLLFLFDAKDYLGKVRTPQILDNMIADGALPPVVAVFIANPDREARSRELPANTVFADVLANSLLPRIASETGLSPDPARTVLAGSSYGGLASATVALSHPERFGNALSLSGSFWWSPPGTPPDRSEHVASRIAGGPRLPVRFFLAAGLFEIAKGGTGGIVETSRHLRDVLEARGYDVTYREYAAGHDYFAWQGELADGLVALFGH